VVAVDGEVVGLVHTVLWHDPAWGALLDNLHVAHGLQRGGVGTGLMARSAAAVLARRPVIGLYLWVLEANTAAQAFYAARGGTCEGSEWSEAPGGGAILGLRYVWRDPTRPALTFTRRSCWARSGRHPPGSTRSTTDTQYRRSVALGCLRSAAAQLLAGS
jgi:GNAT superfamily N-acetyltransferase